MSKSIKNCYDNKLTYINLYNAYYRICKNNRNKKYILKYELDLETNLNNLLYKLKNNLYKPGKYKEFTIYEPKERLIKALPFEDRIVHQWYIEEFIKPYIIPRFIKDSYSCIETKGLHKGVNQLQKYMRIMYNKNKDYYILKCDIKKFFYNIDKNILFDIMKRYISDKKLLNLTKIIIFDNTGDISIPIGNYTSQYFANIYLHELDTYIKQELKIPFYERYMDDFVLLLNSKEESKIIMNKISIFLKDNLHLELNSKSCYFHNKYGVNFLGYKIFNNYILLRKTSKIKMKKKVKKWNKEYENNTLDKQEVLLSLNSWFGHIKHCDSYRLKKEILNSLNFNYNTLLFDIRYEKKEEEKQRDSNLV